MLKIKEVLLTYDFIDNQYLDAYIELVLNNYGTPLKKGCTQKHHIIPVSCYFKDSFDFTSHRKEALQMAAADSNNYQVNLTYADHLRAHYLLCRCSHNIIQIISNAKACELMLRILQPALVAGIVLDLSTPENQQAAYEYIRANAVSSSGSFKPREGSYYKGTRRKHGANCKVRHIETGIVYNSIKEAEVAHGLAKSRLNSILSGYRKQIPGMTFEYYDEASEISEVSK